jgi:hypothetical protein
VVIFRFAWSLLRILVNILSRVLKQILHRLRLKIWLRHRLRQIFVAVLADQVSVRQPPQYGVKRQWFAKKVHSIRFSLVVDVLGWLGFLSVPGELACDATAVTSRSFVWEGIGFIFVFFAKIQHQTVWGSPWPLSRSNQLVISLNAALADVSTSKHWN